ncbi:type II secretion system protein GspG [candidate division WOR-3 bacterium]|nr:type II secretion system protein GspG [candidate division WOR-3 bacterium]
MKDRGPRSLGVIPIAGSLVVVAFLIVLAVQIYGGGKGKDGQAITKPIEQASALQCRTQVRNLKTAIEMYCAENGQYPADLQELGNVGEDMLYCPVTRSAYFYDPQTGRVWCPDHP